MKTAQVITPWTGSGTKDDPNRPLLADQYTLLKWSDVTGQAAANLPPSPNLYTLEIVCDDAVMTTIQNDPNYQVLWVQ
jgi:hypothetical protein